MRDSTLSIYLLFILGLVSICFYWTFQFFGPHNGAPCHRPDVPPLLMNKDLFKGHVIPKDSWPAEFDAVDDQSAAREEEDTDETSAERKPKVKGIVFPPDRTPIEVEVNRTVWEESVKRFKENKVPMDFSRMHFVHVPKAGGTSYNILLRQLLCERDPEENKDCCVPGICYKKRRCDVMVGCFGHIPNRKMLLAPMPSVTIIRNPIERLVSGFLYYGHNPNADSFNVRPYFKDIKHGNLPKMEFADYIELPEYQNILTRMLGADAFPYSNVTVDRKVYGKAIQAMERFFVVGVMEEFNISVELAFKRLQADRIPTADEIPKEREAVMRRRNRKEIILSNSNLIKRAAMNNLYDIQLYRFGVARFCKLAGFHPEVLEKVKKSGKIDCTREAIKFFSKNIVLDKNYA